MERIVGILPIFYSTDYENFINIDEDIKDEGDYLDIVASCDNCDFCDSCDSCDRDRV